MSRSTPPVKTATDQDWSLETIMKEEQERKSGLVAWWYQLTAPPELPAQSSFRQREAVRHGRLLSVVVFFLILTIGLILPATFFIPNHLVTMAIFVVIGICCFSLFMNHLGKTLFAGIIVVASFEIALGGIVLTTTPFDVFNLPLFDLFIMAELLAISLLPDKNVFFIALLNGIFIFAALRWQPHTSNFSVILHTQFYNSLIRPVGLQVIVAVVAYLWARNTSNAIKRADRAEMIASLEHRLAEQKQELEEGIQQIMQTHIAVANGDTTARAPLSQDNALWQIARALNTLLVRYQRASQAERELQRIGSAVSASINEIQKAEQRQQLPQLAFTQTSIDPLIEFINRFMRTRYK